MKKFIINLVALLGVSILGIGIATATPSSDCGDDDVQPINIHSSVKAHIKDV